MAAQRHVAVTQQPQPQKATIVYRSQPVPSNEASKNVGEGRHRGRASRHDGRYTSGKNNFCMKFHFIFCFLHETEYFCLAHPGSSKCQLPVPFITPKIPSFISNQITIF